MSGARRVHVDVQGLDKDEDGDPILSIGMYLHRLVCMSVYHAVYLLVRIGV